jgi:pyruvate formate lyase activating enzyme
LENDTDLERGLIFNIERFAIDDGPGIRTLVFFKGCNLHCSWCQNPESQQKNIEILFLANKCSACGRCIEICPQSAIYVDEEYGYLSDSTKCDGCGVCVKECYYSAREIVGRYYTVAELMHEITKDFHFYEESGGGVTFSGGEPLLQSKFLKQVLLKCRQSGIHTALETAGHVSWTNFKSIAALADLVFIDFKHHESAVHFKETGVSNELIIENIRRLNGIHAAVIVRIPVIPGINFHEETFEKMFLVLSEFENIQHIELLPFHILGKGKYRGLGRTYAFETMKSLKKQDLEQVRKIGNDMGLHVIIGSI